MLGREPDPPVARAQTRILSAAIAFRIEHAVALVIKNGGDLADTPVCYIVKIGFTDAVNAEVAADPKILLFVFDDLKSTVIKKAVFGRVSG